MQQMIFDRLLHLFQWILYYIFYIILHFLNTVMHQRMFFLVARLWRAYFKKIDVFQYCASVFIYLFLWYLSVFYLYYCMF